MQLDFTATPKDLQGNLFPHIVYDYPLAEAIKDRIVKRPRIGEIENLPESLSKDFVKRNRLQIDTGIEILKEFQKVKTYIENYLFDEKVDGEESDVTKRLNPIPIREKLVEIFSKEINTLSRKEETVTLQRYFKLSETQPLHTSEPVTKVRKTVFEALPYSRRSVFEKEFINYLDEKDDVKAFSKGLPRHPLYIPYYNHEGYLRYYQPDFVVKEESAMYLVETKGMEGLEVPIKDREAMRWCENVEKLSGKSWKYLKVKPHDLETYRAHSFRTLATGTEIREPPISLNYQRDCEKSCKVKVPLWKRGIKGDF